MSADIISRFGVVGTLGKPFLNRIAIRRCVIIHPATEAEIRLAMCTHDSLRSQFLGSYDNRTIWTRAKPKQRMRLDVISKDKLLITFSHTRFCQKQKYEIFRCGYVAFPRHTADSCFAKRNVISIKKSLSLSLFSRYSL